MGTFYEKYRNKSVINTDSFDRRMFDRIYKMSGALQNLNDFEKPFPTFEPLLSDIWSSLYKMSPKLKDNKKINEELKTNHSLIKKMLNDDDFERYHKSTKLDELSSAIGTVNFGNKTKQWLEERRQENQELNQKLNEIQSMQRQLEKQEHQNGAGQGNKQLEESLNEAIKDLQDSVSQELNNSGSSLSEHLSQAMQETEETKDDLESLIGGTKAGDGKAELQKTPLKEQIKLAEQLQHNKRLKNIAEWAGRFKQIAKTKQKSMYEDSIEHTGVAIGNDIGKILPSELALYNHESTRLDFLKRFAEGQVMQYATQGKEQLGKGPIICCLDQSGSMSHIDEQSKGFVLALMSIAKRQKRDFCYIPFSTCVEIHRYLKGKITPSEMVQIAESFLSGGTDFQLPLEKAIKVINESHFKQSDIVFVTDGVSDISHSFLKKFNKTKEEKEFSVLSLVIKDDDNYTNENVEKFSDQVLTIEDFKDNSSHTAFEI